jgi:hypothetical protein
MLPDLKVLLKVTTNRNGSRICSVPMKKLKQVSSGRKLAWSLDGEWLVLESI